MALEESSDHVERAKRRLLEQFKGHANLAALLSSFVQGVQGAEVALFEILDETHLDVAIGDNLDMLGRIVGEDRNGREDDAYRLRIRARIKLNLSSGTTEEIIAILLLVLGDAYTFEITNYPPASFRLDISGTLDDETAAEISVIVSLARAAGVGAELVYSVEEDADTFTFASGDTVEASATQGFGDDAQTTGGYFSDVIEA